MGDINRGSSNRLDSGNSSTSTLTANSVFTGTWIDVLEYAMVVVQIIASHASATNGLEIQWSSDGTNLDDRDRFTIPAATGKSFSFGPQARYMRIVYTNGSTNQTYFRLQNILKLYSQKASSHRINDDISTQDDAELVKAILTGETSVGSFENLKVDSAGRLLISSDVATPIDTIEVIQVAQSSISANADTIYTITNGKTLVLQIFQAGAELNSVGGSKISLFEDPNGDLSVLNLITVIYVNGASSEASLSTSYVGNGTRRILMRRGVFGGSSREVFGRWKGFEQ